MLVEVKVPVLAESVPDATLLEWRKKPGEAVKRGDNLIDLETDKVTLEVTAPDDGVLTQILKQSGETVLTGEVLAILDTEAAASAPAPAAAEPASAPQAATVTAMPAKSGPAADKILRENQVEAGSVQGTGPGGRVTKGDALDAVANAKARPAAAAPASVAVTAGPTGPRAEERVRMTRLRQRAAERLLSAQRENALLTTFNEVNMAPIMGLRTKYKDAFEKRHGVKLGFMSFFVAAAVEALKRFPVVNASVDGDDILYHGYFDVGIAVGSERGLVVPILRDADQMSFADIESQISDYGTRARDGKLTIDELTGGTFTITNGGVFGSLLSTPIINPPQSAILGMHKIQDRPVVENGEIVIRPMMYLALSYDHRIIDGREAVQFLVAIKDQVEDPSRILMRV
ncbi:MAG: 2-oxoglutarate dehydrogenase complex dihydrolipoyllysine-residue succinyltransferase [Gammaproteobacteria bacterium]|nr:2-oxoglutarate dehydrogenase complex dihydrolipoyllysine-residue succinyltransferase [Gammaproteobacteria bacterium]